MQLSVDDDFYDFIDSKIQNENNRRELKDVVEDLSTVDYEGSNLQSLFNSSFGGVYHRPDGFVQFILDITGLIQSYFNTYHFNFSLENCLRVIVFEALRPFMVKRLKKEFNTQNFGSKDVDKVYFYLQESNVKLNLQEHLYFTDKQSAIHEFVSGIKSTVKSADEKIKTSAFEEQEEDEEEGSKKPVENSEDESEEFNFDEEEENDGGVSENNGNGRENSGEEEAAAAFEELF